MDLNATNETFLNAIINNGSKGFIKAKPKTSKKKIMAAKKINETKENFCAAPISSKC